MPDAAGLTVAARTPEALSAALDAIDRAVLDDWRPVWEPAREAERIAIELGRPELEMRARLTVADIQGRRGEVAEAGRIAKVVNQWAAEHGDGFLLARSHRQLSIFYSRIGDAAEALVHAVKCVRYTDPAVPPRIRASHLMMYAMCLDLNERYEDAKRRFAEALEIAYETDDPQMCMSLLNNMAYTAYERNDVAAAVDLVEQLREVSRRGGLTLPGLVLDTVARVHLMLGRYAMVEETLRPVLDDPDGPLLVGASGFPECLLTVAEAQRLRGLLRESGESLEQARRLCEERGLGALSARVRQEQAALHAAAGDYRAAYEEYQRFHADTEALRSTQAEARARAVNAVFETEEARRDGERYLELALHDKLTGLYNRRYVDDYLAKAVRRSTGDGSSISVGLLDLDHFKQVNDKLSHGAGDAVLRAVAEVLTAAVADAGTVARLGGEEFLLVLPDTGLAAAVRRGEGVLRALREHSWQEITGDIPVTASIGVATAAGARITPADLLAEADANLYAAKRGGRNRVIGGTVWPGRRGRRANRS